MNDIVWRSVKKPQYSAVEKPVGLSTSDGERPDGATLIPWAREASRWQGTSNIPDTYAKSYNGDMTTRATAAAYMLIIIIIIIVIVIIVIVS